MENGVVTGIVTRMAMKQYLENHGMVANPAAIKKFDKEFRVMVFRNIKTVADTAFDPLDPETKMVSEFESLWDEAMRKFNLLRKQWKRLGNAELKKQFMELGHSLGFDV